MANLMSYVEHLSEEIGPRPATTDSEERAALFIRDVFESRGLETTVQHFEAPRTYSWAYVVYHLLTISAALLSRSFEWAAFLLAAGTAVIMWLDLDTKWGLTALFSKGPSQNVIAKHVPRLGRNERVQRVVVVAHYDTARTSLAFSPSMVKNFAATFGLMKSCTYAVPILIALRIIGSWLPFGAKLEPWGWYLTLVAAVYLLVPALINAHREFFMPYSPGANDNASGVAALLGVFERLVPEPDTPAPAATREYRRAAAPTLDEDDEDLLPGGSLLNFAPIAAPASSADVWNDDEDISWDTGVLSGQTSLGFESALSRAPKEDVAPAGPVQPTDEQSLRLFGTTFPMAPRTEKPVRAEQPVRSKQSAQDSWGDALDEDTAPLDMSGAAIDGDDAPASRRRLFGGSAAEGAPTQERHGLRDWLGLGGDFDARRKGREIGSWDKFEEEDEDEAGWKGGAAAIEDPEDPNYTASVVARIRRKVTTNVDRDLIEKEVWFVATGAEEVGTAGMRAFLDEHGHDLKDAVIINLDNIGAGAVAYVTREGMARLYTSDRRTMSAARRAIREADLPVKGREYRGLSTDATPALARGYRAMSVMAFDINGRLPNWHWSTDTADNVSEANIETAVNLVTAIIREL